MAKACAHRAEMGRIPEAVSLPEVMCPVFFYSLVYGLLWQGCILMKSLWKKMCMVQNAGLWTGTELLPGSNGFFLCRCVCERARDTIRKAAVAESEKQTFKVNLRGQSLWARILHCRPRGHIWAVLGHRSNLSLGHRF